MSTEAEEIQRKVSERRDMLDAYSIQAAARTLMTFLENANVENRR
jgi:hypothetical protein